MKKILVAAFLCGIMLLGGADARAAEQAGEVRELREMMEEQSRIIGELLLRIEALEAERTRSEYSAAATPEAFEEAPLWTERVIVSGDLRLRYENIDDERKSADRNRNRIRARVGLKAEVNDEVDVGFQLSTGEPNGFNGGGDPLSGNQTMTGAFENKDFWLSLAYADWHPGRVPGLSVLGGKMKHPLFKPGKSELIWDGDLNPEGAAVKYSKSFDSLEVFANAFGFWTLERKADADSGLFGAQGGVKKDFVALEDKAYMLVGAGYYDHGNIEGQTPYFDGDGDDFGNSLDTSGAFAHDYDLFEAFGEFGFRTRNTPVLLFADYVNNTATGDDDEAWSLGFKVGKMRAPGSLQFKYLYKETEKDAVVGGFTDSDFGGGGTGSRGHEMGLGYQIAKNWQLILTYFHNETGIASGEEENDYDNIRLDTTFKF